MCVRQVLIILLSLNFTLSYSQTTYTSNPSQGSYASCPTTDISSSCPSGTFLGNTIKFKLHDITTSNFVFRAIKCGGGSFSQGGTGYVKEGGVCGTVEGSDNINIGDNTSTVSIPIPSGFTSGTKYYYFTLNSDNGQKFHGGSVSVTASTPPSYMEFASCINTTAQVEMGSNLEYEFDIEVQNSGLQYFIQVLLADPNNSSNYQLLSNNVRTFELGVVENFDLSKQVTMPPGDYKLFIYANGTGTASDDFVHANGCSPSMTSSSGTVTHFKDIQVLPPCSDGASVNITNPQAGAAYTGGFTNVTWNGSLQYDDCLVDVYYSEGQSGMMKEIEYGISDDGHVQWPLNPTNLNSTNVYVHVEYVEKDANGNTVKDVIGPISVGTSVVAPTLSDPNHNAVINSYPSNINFEWDKNNATADYEIRLRDTTLDVVLLDYHNVGDNDSYEFTNSSALINGNVYRWVVRANSGGEVAESPPNIFSIGAFGLDLDFPLKFLNAQGNLVASLNEGETFTFDTRIKNLGTADWSGSLYLKVNNSPISEFLGYYTIAAGGSQLIAYPFTPTFDHVGTQVDAELFYQTNGQGSSYSMGSLNNHSNPRQIDIIGNSLTWLTPTANSTYQAGTDISGFTWASTGGIQNVTIDLHASGGSFLEHIAEDIPNSGAYNTAYTVPADFPPGDYQLKIYKHPDGPVHDFIGPITISNPSSYSLTLSQAIDANPSPVILGTPTSLTAEIKNTANTNYTGSFRIIIENPDGVLDTLTQDNNISLNLNETHTISAVTDFSSSIAGNHIVTIEYNPVPVLGGENWFPVDQNNFLNPRDLNVLDPSGTCYITNPAAGNTEAYDAVQYLCGFGVIQQPTDGNVNPTADIIKEDLAKVIFISLYDFDEGAPTDADDFPVPFGDMQDQANQAYARYGKVLSFLEYGDGVSPFNRRFYNYRPGSKVTRGQVAKVIVEAFDFSKDVFIVPFSDVPTAHPEFLHIAKLADLGIASSSQANFRPDDYATRQEVFIMLYRLLNNCPNCIIPDPVDADFYNPGNYTPYNLGNHPGVADANFDQYAKSSFSIPGRNIPLVFEHSYNSYLTELQDELFCVYNSANDWISFRPLGNGWSHSYNSYILKIPGYSYPAYGLYKADSYVVFWPNGTMDVYEGNASNLSKVTKGNYDDISYDISSQTFSITKKNQMVYTYDKENTITDAWPYVLTKIEDRNGNEVSLDYENFSGGGIRLKQVTGTAGRKLTFNYNSNSTKISSVVDPASRIINFSYGGANGDDLMNYSDAENYNTTYNYSLEAGKEHLLTVITMPNGNFVNNSYEQRKLTSSTTNSSGGNVSTQDIDWELGSTPQAQTYSTVKTHDGTNEYTYDYTHDKNGRIKELSTPTNDLEDALYEDFSNPTLPTSVTIDGITTTYAYDNMGNVLTVNQVLGVNHSFTYNSINDITTYTNPRNKITSFTYEGSGNLDVINAPIGSTSFDYNNYGQVDKISNPEGLITNINYDNYGNVKKVIGPEGITNEATYDILGRVLTSKNPNSQITAYDYDDRDFLVKITDPLQYETEYDYDGNGNLKWVENAKGIKTEMSYGYFDWMESISFGGLTKEFDYDQEGKLIEVTKPDGYKLNYNYDVNGNRLGNGYATFTYDSKNRLKTVTKDGKVLSYQYDDLHRITRTTYDNVNVDYTYDVNSNVKKIIYPGNKEVEYDYDDKDRLIIVEDWNNNITSYTYLQDDRLDQIEYPNGVKSFYVYDNAGRMTKTYTLKSSTDTIVRYDFVLDLVGNHIEEKTNVDLITSSYTDLASTANYDNKNQILDWNGITYNHDDNGNIDTQTGRDYSWDKHDMLTSISGDINAVYKYDGLGNRRTATIEDQSRKFVLDVLGMSQVLMETDFSNNPQNYYVYGLGLISRIKPDGTTRYYHGDFRGSTVAITDAAQNVTHSYQYDAFGKTMHAVEEDENIFKFVGLHGVQEDFNGLHFMRARYYDPDIGRFLSEDPVWSNNLYSYGLNNPSAYFDPKGEFPLAIGLAVAVLYTYGTYKFIYEIDKAADQDDFEKVEQLILDRLKGKALMAATAAIPIKISSNEGLNYVLKKVGSNGLRDLAESDHKQNFKHAKTLANMTIEKVDLTAQNFVERVKYSKEELDSQISYYEDWLIWNSKQH